MPLVANPQARSRNGLLAPMVSSRSFGPEPCTRTTAGQGPTPALGSVSVPGNRHSPRPTVNSFSRNALVRAYGGGSLASAAGWLGTKNKPATCPLTSNTTFVSSAIRSNWQVTSSTSYPTTLVALAPSCFWKAPSCAWRACQVSRSFGSGNAVFIVASNRATAPAKSSLVSNSTNRSPALVTPPGADRTVNGAWIATSIRIMARDRISFFIIRFALVSAASATADGGLACTLAVCNCFLARPLVLTLRGGFNATDRSYGS